MSVLTVPTPTPSSAVPVPRWKTVAELLHDLGDIPAHRVRFDPYPGTATEEDAVRVTDTERLVELVDGTLVEKTLGMRESFLTVILISALWEFVRSRQLGIVTATDGMYRMIHGNIREPDAAFTARHRLQLPLPPVGGWCPDLCVEVLSPDNTRAEMARKRQEYFASGCRLVWEIDPRGRTADVYTDPTAATRLDENGTLDGGTVLPGFTLPLADLFAEYDAMLNPSPPQP